MRLLAVDHPLVAHKLTVLRNAKTDSPTFRRLADELVTLLAYEATRDARVDEVEVETPVAPARGAKLSAPKPLVVPILRAGLGMLDGMARLLPTAEIGFVGMIRDDETLQATTYARRLPGHPTGRHCYVPAPRRAPAAQTLPATAYAPRLPGDLTGRRCYVLDPMLATGGTLAAAVQFLADRGADHITAVCLLVAPEGLELLKQRTTELQIPVTVVTAAVDERLNEKGYIVPGLGDAGDRLYGVVD